MYCLPTESLSTFSQVFSSLTRITEERTLESRKQTPPPKSLLFLTGNAPKHPHHGHMADYLASPADHAQEMVLPMGGSTQVLIKNADTPWPRPTEPEPAF